MPASLGECDLSSLQNERGVADEHLVLFDKVNERKKIKKREKPLDLDVKRQQQQKN